jgi:hypothetical protein
LAAIASVRDVPAVFGMWVKTYRIVAIRDGNSNENHSKQLPRSQLPPSWSLNAFNESGEKSCEEWKIPF